MDQLEYEQLLTKADKYFAQGKYKMFLDEFNKCYAFNTDCFNNENNIFKFSLSILKAKYIACSRTKPKKVL